MISMNELQPPKKIAVCRFQIEPPLSGRVGSEEPRNITVFSKLATCGDVGAGIYASWEQISTGFPKHV